MEEVANDQSKALEQERDKRLDATRTLKNSEADLLKAREDLKEMTRAMDSSMEHMCLGLKLIRHMWEVSLPNVGLSKIVKAANKSSLKRTILANWGLRL